MKQQKTPAFGELGNVGEALFRGLGQQYMQDRAAFARRVGSPINDLEIADFAEIASIAMVASILPAPDRAAMEDIVHAGMLVDHLPIARADHRIQEGLHHYAG